MTKVLFLHIPKTAGTSVLNVLCNVFGDENVQRLTEANCPPQGRTESMRSWLDSKQVLVSHFPFAYWQSALANACAFTVLREPVSRVLSLFRFLRRQPVDELARHGLRPDFSIEEFLSCENIGISSQIENGMCVSLGGLLQGDRFVVPNDPAELLGRARENLRRLNVAFVDNLPETLNEFARSWGVPFRVDLPEENVTADEGEFANRGDFPDSAIEEIIARNILDRALYEQELEQVRPGPAPQPHLSAKDYNAASLFQIVAGSLTPIGKLPGRMGFYSREAGTLAWVREGGAVIHCLSQEATVSLALSVYSIADDYPLETIRIAINGKSVQAKTLRVGERHFELMVFDQRFVYGLNRIDVSPETYIPVRKIDPGSGDRRHLAIALKHIRIF